MSDTQPDDHHTDHLTNPAGALTCVSDALPLDEAEDPLGSCENLADEAQNGHPHNGRHIQPIEGLDHLAGG